MFDDCDGLVELTVHAPVTQIRDYAFANCDMLEELTFENIVLRDVTATTTSNKAGLFYDGSSSAKVSSKSSDASIASISFKLSCSF